MPAPARISLQDLVNALLRWRGNVRAASDELGIAANSLYERINRSGLDLAAFRNRDPSKPVIPITSATGVTGMTGFGTDRHAQENAGAIFTRRAGAASISPVSSAVAVAEFLKTKKTTRAPRVMPHHLDKLTEAKFDLQALLRRDLTEGQILEMCLDECLADWVAKKIESLRQAQAEQPTERPGPRGRGKDKR